MSEQEEEQKEQQVGREKYPSLAAADLHLLYRIQIWLPWNCFPLAWRLPLLLLFLGTPSVAVKPRPDLPHLSSFPHLLDLLVPSFLRRLSPRLLDYLVQH